MEKTRDLCLALAIDCESRAEDAPDERARAEMIEAAESWRVVAEMAMRIRASLSVLH